MDDNPNETHVFPPGYAEEVRAKLNRMQLPHEEYGMPLKEAKRMAGELGLTIDADFTLYDGDRLVGEIHRVGRNRYDLVTGLDDEGIEGGAARKVIELSDRFNKLVKENPLPEDYPDFEECKERLRRTEWQRWVPGLGIYRLIRDGQNKAKNHDILDTMHSVRYEFANCIYNAVVNSAFLIGAIYGLSELLK